MQGTICNLLIKIIVSFVIEEFENRWENWNADYKRVENIFEGRYEFRLNGNFNLILIWKGINF